MKAGQKTGDAGFAAPNIGANATAPAVEACGKK